jgi:hypothetical protein
MNLPRWLAEGKLRRHETSEKEIGDILKLVERDLADAAIPQLSSDRRFATAYNASLALATIALHAAGYRTAGSGAHWITFQALPEIMGETARERADYLDGCRTKRNVTDYDRAGEISETEAEELVKEAANFRKDLLSWLAANHPELLSA